MKSLHSVWQAGCPRSAAPHVRLNSNLRTRCVPQSPVHSPNTGLHTNPLPSAVVGDSQAVFLVDQAEGFAHTQLPFDIQGARNFQLPQDMSIGGWGGCMGGQCRWVIVVGGHGGMLAALRIGLG